MRKRNIIQLLTGFALLGLIIIFSACSAEAGKSQEAPVSTPQADASQTITPSSEPLEPTMIPVELAAQVNGEGITLAEYQAELARFRAAAGTELATEDEEQVIQSMIDQVLLAQAAAEAGLVVDDAMVQERIDQLDIDEQALSDWIAAHGYTEESFREALARSIAAAWMRDQIINAVPETTEQVHARQILLYNSEEADDVFAQLEAGADFETLAAQYDPIAQGYLGWFPQGYLTVPELDDVIFNLTPGEYSAIIETMLGFHIIQVIERDSAHPLDPNAYRVVQSKALEMWLQNRQNQSEIVIYLP